MHVIRSPIVYISIQASKKYKYERQGRKIRTKEGAVRRDMEVVTERGFKFLKLCTYVKIS